MGAFLPWYTFTAVILLAIHGDLCVDIIGGNEVAPHSRPFMAQIKGRRGIICGGALIKENWVLTAAHCNTEMSQGSFWGLFFWSDIVWSANPTAWGIGDALVNKLRGRAKLNKAVQTIPLPPSDYDPKPGTVCTVAGWGMTTSPVRNCPGNLPSALMEVNVTVIRREICNDKKHYNGKPVITKNMICAGAKNKDSCHGDSGGPLRCNNIMRGITSFGKKKCGNADGPGVYTRLTKQHLKWIRKTIGGA